MGVLEHIDTLIALANSQGASMSDRTRVAYIIGSAEGTSQGLREGLGGGGARKLHSSLVDPEAVTHSYKFGNERKEVGKAESVCFVGAAQDVQVVYCLPNGKIPDVEIFICVITETEVQSLN